MSNMPSHLTGTTMEQTWNQIVDLAAKQSVQLGQPIDVSGVPAEEVQALCAVGAAEVTNSSDGKPMCTLKYADEAPTADAQDVTGATAAAKKHTFATQ